MKKSSLAAVSLLAVLAACTQPPGGPSAPPAVGPDTLNVADAAIAGGDPNMALSVSQSVLQTDATNVDALIHEGDAYYALMRCPAAEAAYQLALQGDPKSTAAETGMGRCLIKTDPKSAEAALLLAVQDDPGNAAALNDLGIARDLQGNFAGAVGPYQQALLAQPGMTAAEVNLGLSLALSGHGPEALQYLGPLATGQGATPKIREDYAAALTASGRENEARQVLSIDLAPDQVQPVLDSFNAIIAASQAPLAPPPPPVVSSLVAPTAPQVQTAAVTAAPLPGDPPMLTPAAQPVVPDIMAPPPDDTPANANAAYSGPSPIPGAVSSSTPAPSVTSDPAPADAAAAGALPPPVKQEAAAPAAAAPAGAAPADPAPEAAAPAADPPPAPASTAGGYQVQLGALNSAPAAADAWNKITGRMPALFAGRNPDIESASVNGRTFYRLRTGTFPSRSAAEKFCSTVTSAGHACTIADF
jgi:Flp pilus assembly protein TadD/cell division protein FtsN